MIYFHFFTKYVFFHSNFKASDSEERADFTFNYFENTTINAKHQCYKEKLQRKLSFDFSSNIEKLKEEEESIEKTLLLHLLQPTNINTSYVTIDENFEILVLLPCFF